MKIGLQTWGSDGDILPFLALANGLATAGHEVTLVYTSADNKDYTAIQGNQKYKMIKAYDRFDLNVEKAMKIGQTKNRLKQLTLIMELYYDPAVEAMYDASRMLCTQNDIVIGHCYIHTLATTAQLFDRPRVVVTTGPYHIPTKYCSPLGINLGEILNRVLWKLCDRHSYGENLFRVANEISSREGLKPIISYFEELYTSKQLTLLATSKALVKRQPDWGEHIQICGFMYQPVISENWTMPDDLKAFIDAGSPPVFYTFGSITQYDIENTTKLLIDAAKLCGQRAIIYSYWDKLSNPNLSPDIYCIGKSPYDQIFPHCAAIVHHGGVGTTQASLNAGCPSIVVEHIMEQEYWGCVLNRLGVSRRPLHRRTITAKTLAKQIDKIVNSQKAKQNAQAIAAIMHKEKGIARAVELIERRFEYIEKYQV
jgi:sterol 3beta-glucosyltransferase